jgi:CubicO group peptidase (beta-lactamase class C family)
MKLITKFPFYACIVLLLGACGPSKPEMVDELFIPYTGNDVPGASILIIKDGSKILLKAYGMVDLEHKIPAQPNTNYRLASVTKQFTAMSIMMLVEQGRLKYDATLSELFPGFPSYGKNITIRHLLTHTAGLLDYEGFVPDSSAYQVLDRDVLEIIKKADSTYFEAGTSYRYSNTGYALLALIVEKVSGKMFDQFLKEHIFEPLGMKSTVAHLKDKADVIDRAYGYSLIGPTFKSTDQSPWSAVLGDGGIYSSVEDLYKWDQALYTEKLVSSRTLSQAFTPNVLLNGKQTDYGFGWRIDTLQGHRRVHHTGSTRGFATIIQRYTDDTFSIIILTNRSEPALNELADRIAEIYLHPAD